MKKKIQIQIDDPCHEDWDKMTPKEQGRYCDSCSKVVIDFSGWSDGRISDFLKENRSKDMCGNFFEDQLNRPISNSYQGYNTFNLKAVLLGASLTSLLSLESCKSSKRVVGGFGFSEVKKETSRFLLENQNVSKTVSFEIKVSVLSSNNGKPLDGAYVDICDSLGNFICDGETDINGNCLLQVNTDYLPYQLSVHRKGYFASFEFLDDEMKNGELTFQLKRDRALIKRRMKIGRVRRGKMKF